MSKKFGKSINLFLIEGDPTSIITAELSNWNATCIKVPRHKIIEYKERFQQCGVYFLFTADAEVYIGEAENIFDRLNSHLYNYEHEKVEYYFTHIVVFESEKLNKSMVRYLENKSKLEVEKHNQIKVLTKSTYGKTVLKESDISECEEFFENMKIIMKVFGYNIFEPKIKPALEEKETKKEIEYWEFTNKNKKTNETQYAKGYISENGFTLCKGIKIIRSRSEQDSTFSKKINSMYDKLEKENIIDINGILKSDFEFSSPSMAAEMVVGTYWSGPSAFKNKNGILLRDYKKEE